MGPRLQYIHRKYENLDRYTPKRLIWDYVQQTQINVGKFSCQGTVKFILCFMFQLLFWISKLMYHPMEIMIRYYNLSCAKMICFMKFLIISGNILKYFVNKCLENTTLENGIYLAYKDLESGKKFLLPLKFHQRFFLNTSLFSLLPQYLS